MTKKYIFHNFTDKPFTGYWNGKPITFKPGIKKDYPRLITRHFAKHLTNQILTDGGKDETIKNGERYTSPKKPDEVPVFMEIFNKAFIVEEIPDEDNLEIIEGGQTPDEPSMNINTKSREIIDPYDASQNKTTPKGVPQTIGAEVGGDDEGSDESEYEDKTDNKTKDGDSEAK